MLKISLVCIVLLIISSPVLSREFDKSWEKKSFPNSQYVEYQRKINITATHAGFSNTTNYPLRLENNEILIYEIDDDLGFGINIREFGEFSVKKDGNGKAAMYTVAIKNLRYFDLNGDGYFDSRYDANKQQAEILFEDKYIPVLTAKGTVSLLEKQSLDGNTKYLFSDKQWKKIHP